MTFPVDNERLKTVAQCDTRYVMRHVLGLTGKDAKDAANAGSAVHDSLEMYFRSMGDKPAAMEALATSWDGYFGDIAPLEQRLSLGNIYDIMDVWYDAHTVDVLPFTWDPNTVDVALSTPLMDGFEMFLKIDLPVYMKADGMPWVLDHKTTGKINAWWLKPFKMASQLTGYIWGQGQRLAGMPMGEALINAIELSELPSSRRKCKKHGVKFSECRKQHANWQVFTLTRNAGTLASWKREAEVFARKCKRLDEGYRDLGLLEGVRMQGQFNGSCNQFCEYLKFCQMGRPIDMVAGMFVGERWAPWDIEK